MSDHCIQVSQYSANEATFPASEEHFRAVELASRPLASRCIDLQLPKIKLKAIQTVYLGVDGYFNLHFIKSL